MPRKYGVRATQNRRGGEQPVGPDPLCRAIIMLFASQYRATRTHEGFGLNPLFHPSVTFSSAAEQAAILVRYGVFLEKSMESRALWSALRVWRLLRSCEKPWATRASGGKSTGAKVDEPICAKFLLPSLRLFPSRDGSFRFYCNNCARRSF